MVGGNEEDYKKHEHLFRDIAAERAYSYVGPAGAGHFVKMVHNGVEYGMMQSLAEGFAVLRAAADTRRLDAEERRTSADSHGTTYKFDLKKIAELYNEKSVIESRLVGWLAEAYEKYGEDLSDVSGTVKQSGEGLWTVQTAKELGVPAPVIETAVEFRKQSETNPSYIGKVLSALRGIFGGHNVANL